MIRLFGVDCHGEPGEIDKKDLQSNSPLKISCWSKEGESKNFKIDVYNVVY